MERQHLVIFFCAFWLSLLWSVDQFIYFMLLVGFKNIRKCLIKTYRSERCDSNKCFVLLWTCLYKKANYLSVNNPFVPLLNYWCLQKINLDENMDITKKLEACRKCKRKWINFPKIILKKYKLECKRNNISWTLSF